MRAAFQEGLSELFGREVEVSEPVLLAGGASKEAWAVDADGEQLIVRRAAATVMHHHTLTLAQESTYAFYCKYHKASGMVGAFELQ